MPTLRAYFATIAVAAHRYGVQGASLRKGAPGALDIAQASYLPLTDIFVVDDAGMYEHMNEVVRLARLTTTVVDYEGMRKRLGEPFSK